MRNLTLNEIEQVSGANALTGLVDVAIGAAGSLLGAGVGLVLANALENVTLYNFVQGTLAANAAAAAGSWMAISIPPVAFVVGGGVVGVAVVSNYMLS